MDVGFKKKTTVSQSLFEFARRRNLKENEIEDILQVPSFKRLANDFDVNIKASHSQMSSLYWLYIVNVPGH